MKKTKTKWTVRVETDEGVLLRETASWQRYAWGGVTRVAALATGYGLAAGAAYAISMIPEAGDIIQDGISRVSELTFGHGSTLERFTSSVTGFYGFSKTTFEVNNQTLLWGIRFGEDYYSRDWLLSFFRR